MQLLYEVTFSDGNNTIHHNVLAASVADVHKKLEAWYVKQNPTKFWKEDMIKEVKLVGQEGRDFIS